MQTISGKKVLWYQVPSCKHQVYLLPANRVHHDQNNLFPMNPRPNDLKREKTSGNLLIIYQTSRNLQRTLRVPTNPPIIGKKVSRMKMTRNRKKLLTQYPVTKYRYPDTETYIILVKKHLGTKFPAASTKRASCLRSEPITTRTIRPLSFVCVPISQGSKNSQ